LLIIYILFLGRSTVTVFRRAIITGSCILTSSCTHRHLFMFTKYHASCQQPCFMLNIEPNWRIHMKKKH